MTDNQPRVLNQLLALGDNPDDIHYDEHNGHGFIVLGPSSQAALDKLATVTAQAAADNRARNLRKVA